MHTPPTPDPTSICDSCGDQPVVRVVPTPGWMMILDDQTHVFEEGHALCAECERLWLAGDRDGMVDRSFRKLRSQLDGPLDPEVLDMMRLVQLPLWSAREERDGSDSR